MFVPRASKIWTKSYGPNYKKFRAFWQKIKKGVFETIFDKALVPGPFEDVSAAETIFDAKLLISRLSSFSIPKFTIVRHL